MFFWEILGALIQSIEVEITINRALCERACKFTCPLHNNVPTCFAYFVLTCQRYVIYRKMFHIFKDFFFLTKNSQIKASNFITGLIVRSASFPYSIQDGHFLNSGFWFVRNYASCQWRFYIQFSFIIAFLYTQFWTDRKRFLME